jgi:hypothetical protein
MPVISIVYAYRNRNTSRIKASLESLNLQAGSTDFEVIFMDYGSSANYQNSIQQLVESYAFATYYYVGHPGLLWCKARALNYGIQQAQSDRIFIADVDVVFHHDFIKQIKACDFTNRFYLFDIAYLKPSLSPDDVMLIGFKNRPYSHVQYTFGVGLFSKEALLKVNGLDTFFHFYGSEDEDLNRRLQHAGYQKEKVEGVWLQHIWHERYPKSKDRSYTLQPRIFNIMRINQQHMLYNDQLKVDYTSRGIDSTTYFSSSDYERLHEPEKIYHSSNKCAEVDHCINLVMDEWLKVYNIVQFEFTESKLPKTKKYKIKKSLGKTVQPYYDFKVVNDLLLKQILLKYRDYNYKLNLSESPNQIKFTIENH